MCKMHEHEVKIKRKNKEFWQKSNKIPQIQASHDTSRNKTHIKLYSAGNKLNGNFTATRKPSLEVTTNYSSNSFLL